MCCYFTCLQNLSHLSRLPHSCRYPKTQFDGSEFWYKGEIGFFDFYIIPLAKKLKECGVFGVSSDEYLNYAIQNREEWVSKGEAVVAEMVAKYTHLTEQEVAEEVTQSSPSHRESFHDETDDEGK